MTIIGTSHFRTAISAMRYYRDYYADFDETSREVDRKISAGEIHIGPPSVKPGQRLTMIDNHTRYAIVEA